MIHQALELLRSEAEVYLKALPELNAGNSFIELSNLAKDDGAISIANNHLGLTLINVEEERIGRDVVPHKSHPDKSISHRNPDLRLNLYLLVAAHFGTYKTALEYLSGVIRFFQQKSVFTPQNSPGMPLPLGKLVVELYPMSFEALNNLWAYLGGKYQPSVVYKVRAVTVQEDAAKDQQVPITTVDIAGIGKEAG